MRIEPKDKLIIHADITGNNMLKKLLFIITTAMVLVSSYLVFTSPIPIRIENAAGDPINFKIFYFHVPIAITAYIAFTIVFISGLVYLKSKNQKWDIIGLSAAEVGVVFAALTLLTGSLWGKSAWQVYWNPADARLNTYMILFLTYLAYLMVRSSIDEPEKRARLSAVFSIIGYITVPLSYFSIIIMYRISSVLQTHPNPAAVSIGGKDILVTLFANMIAYILLCISLILLRVNAETLREDIAKIKMDRNL
ncbi:MAG: cytochrome c biogenesis protein [Candidatus Methanoperedens sp.]|nr:cytochrome c biogenesis protein [Candidatus Methanoperedens sp.]